MRPLVVFDFDLTLTIRRVFGDRDFDKVESYLFGGKERVNELKKLFRTFSQDPYGFRFVIASWNFFNVIVEALKRVDLLEFFVISNSAGKECSEFAHWQNLNARITQSNDENGPKTLFLIFDRPYITHYGGYSAGKLGLMKQIILRSTSSFSEYDKSKEALFSKNCTCFFDDTMECLDGMNDICRVKHIKVNYSNDSVQNDHESDYEIGGVKVDELEAILKEMSRIDKKDDG